MARKKLGEMLVDAGVLTETSLRAALNEQRRWGGTLGRQLVEMKLISESELVRVLSLQLNLPAVDLDHIEIPQAVLDLVPVEVAEDHNLVPFAQPMKFLDVAMADPTNLGVLDELRIRTQLNIRPHLAGPRMLERALGKFYGRAFGRAHRPEIPISIEGADVMDAPAPLESATHKGGTMRDGLRTRPRQTASSLSPPPPAAMVAGATAPLGVRDAEIDALQTRISRLEALVARDEEVLRKVLALLVEKNVASRDEILDRIK
jgi:type IV pilus assembly protein PilB